VSSAPDAVLPCMNRALDGMVRMMDTLGDARVNQRPSLSTTNAPYAILAHGVGLTHDVLGAVLGGRQVQRDREPALSA
jgi:hypothetical protein